MSGGRDHGICFILSCAGICHCLQIMMWVARTGISKNATLVKVSSKRADRRRGSRELGHSISSH